MRGPTQVGGGSSPVRAAMRVYVERCPSRAISASTSPLRPWDGSHSPTSAPAAVRVHFQVV
jgi:hypothetical protein